MIKCFKCDTVLILKETLRGYRICKCCNLQVDNNMNQIYATEWKLIAIKKDNKQLWRNII